MGFTLEAKGAWEDFGMWENKPLAVVGRIHRGENKGLKLQSN